VKSSRIIKNLIFLCSVVSATAHAEQKEYLLIDLEKSKSPMEKFSTIVSTCGGKILRSPTPSSVVVLFSTEEGICVTENSQRIIIQQVRP
jgi:hypothetical protein